MDDTDVLIERAKLYWEEGHILPLDLFAALNEAGLNVEALEDQYLK